MPNQSWPGLPRPKAPLPDPHDFGADEKWALDARSAWDHFGKLTLSQAWELFSKNPLHYQEDFMFMGPVAFAYYFPVLDRHLREARPTDEYDDCEAWIIGCSVEDQLESGHHFGKGFFQEVADLAAYMKGFVERFGLEDGANVTRVWEKVEAAAGKCRDRE
jgi:hypothetical protein